MTQPIVKIKETLKRPTEATAMDHRPQLARTLIFRGTLINLSAVAVLIVTMFLSARDAADHRQQAVALLREAKFERVQLVDWTAPANSLTWLISAGGFALAFLGVRVGLAGSTNPKPVPERDWAERAVA